MWQILWVEIYQRLGTWSQFGVKRVLTLAGLRLLLCLFFVHTKQEKAAPTGFLPKTRLHNKQREAMNGPFTPCNHNEKNENKCTRAHCMMPFGQIISVRFRLFVRRNDEKWERTAEERMQKNAHISDRTLSATGLWFACVTSQIFPVAAAAPNLLVVTFIPTVAGSETMRCSAPLGAQFMYTRAIIFFTYSQGLVLHYYNIKLLFCCLLYEWK